MRRQPLRKIAIIAGATLSVALLSASLASAGSATSTEHAKNLAAKQCTSEKKADKGAFKAAFGKHATRNCIQGTTDETKAELENAAQACRADRQDDPQAFQDTWGTEQSQGRNAFGKCVSSTAREEVKEDVAEFKNAAQACRSEREDDPAAFQEKYGTEESKGKNAFGKCVSSMVKHSDDDETTG
jgi:hypothetical protein